MLTELLLILFLLSLVFFLCFFTISFFTGAPFVTTPFHIVNEMMELADINNHDTVMDLGSGDGRILVAAAKRGAKAKGWEINPFLVAWSQLMAYRFGVAHNLSVVCQTYQHANLKTATVVIFYNIPGHISGIEKKLQSDLKPGTKILSYKFALKQYKPVKQTATGIFYYKKP